jgi:glucoamylase
MKLIVFCLFIFIAKLNLAHAQEAFGAPGYPNSYNNAKKVHVATSAPQSKSKVWLTLTDGILTEVYQPSITQMQLKDSQILIVDEEKKLFWQEKTDLFHSVEVLKPWLVKLINRHPQGLFTIEHIFTIDDNDDTIIDEIKINSRQKNLKFYLLTNPQLSGYSLDDSAILEADRVSFKDAKNSLTVTTTPNFEEGGVGFVGVSDGFQDLSQDKEFNFKFKSAIHGNVVSTLKLNLDSDGKVEINYKFNNARIPNHDSKNRYSISWNQYISKLTKQSSDQDLYARSLFTLKVHEDKNYPGAFVASLSIPWGDRQVESSPENLNGGYRLVWPRDLYHIASALLLAGDRDSAVDSLRFLKKIQYRSGTWDYQGQKVAKFGAFPQNVWTNGQVYWDQLQLDQVGYPVLLFAQVWKLSTAAQRAALLTEFSEMLTNALNFIQLNGPWSAQERWEENFGLSPSTTAIAIAALKTSKTFFSPEKSESYLKKAQDWLNQFDKWMLVTNSPYFSGQYYLRVSACDQHQSTWNPNEPKTCYIANNGGAKDQREILDQGFLHLSLLGLKDPRDAAIGNSLQLVNRWLSVKTPNGVGWYRYSHDNYGGYEGAGRLWPLLSAEHAKHYLELYQVGAASKSAVEAEVKKILYSLEMFANEGMMIPEQVFESTGEGSGAATPLAWAHAEYIKLHLSLKNFINLDHPQY